MGIDDAVLEERRRCAAAVANMSNQRHALRVITGDPLAQIPPRYWAMDIIDDHIRSGLTHEAALVNAFTDWFRSEESSCDFWSECDAPERLAAIAVDYFARLRR